MNVFRKKNPYLFQKWKTSIPSHEQSQETQGRDVRGAPRSVAGVPLTCLSAVPKPEAGFLIMSLGRGYEEQRPCPLLWENSSQLSCVCIF